jgi:hypothetical protein
MIDPMVARENEKSNFSMLVIVLHNPMTPLPSYTLLVLNRPKR